MKYRRSPPGASNQPSGSKIGRARARDCTLPQALNEDIVHASTAAVHRDRDAVSARRRVALSPGKSAQIGVHPFASTICSLPELRDGKLSEFVVGDFRLAAQNPALIWGQAMKPFLKLFLYFATLSLALNSCGRGASKSEVTDLHSQISELGSRLSDLVSRIDDLETEKDAHESRIDDLEGETEDVKSQVR